MAVNALNNSYYSVLRQLIEIEVGNLESSLERLFLHLTEIKERLEKMEISREVVHLLVYLLAALCDRFILTHFTNENGSTSTRQIIGNSLEVKLFGSANAGIQLVKNIKSVCDCGDRPLAQIYIEALRADIFHNAYAQHLNTLKVKFNLNYVESSDPFLCSKIQRGQKISIVNYFEYRFILLFCVAGYILTSWFVWLYAIG